VSKFRIPVHCLATAAALLHASADLRAADSDAQPLEEVVVTAQFRPQKLQDVPISMTVVTADTIEQQQLTNLVDIATTAPNVILRDGGGGFGKVMQAYIRYVGQSDYSFTEEPGVGVYVDDEYLSTLFGSLLELLDVDRVEVYRGPQGTLFGKDSIGGAIRLVTSKPQGDASARLEATAGSMSRRDLRAMIDVPLVANTLFVRFAALSEQRDGYIEQLDYGCEHPDLGGIVNPGAPLLPLLTARASQGNCRIGDLGGKDIQGARLSLRWLINERLEANFAADWMNDHSEAAAQTLAAVNTNFADPSNPLGGFNANVAVPLYGIPYDGRFIAPGFYQSYLSFGPLPHVGPSDTAPSAVTGVTTIPDASGVESYGATATLDWNVLDSLQLKSVSTYRGYAGLFSNDTDNSPLNEIYQENILDHRQFSQELRATGSGFEGRLSWTAGLFYFDSVSLNRGPVDLAALSWFDGAFDFNQHDSTDARDRAAYLQGEFKLSQRLTLTTGVRYTSEDKDYVFDHSSFTPGVPDLIPRTEASVSYARANPRVALNLQWTTDLMTYVSAASGFRAGGFNGRPFDPAQVTSFGPETLKSYEVGLKGEWLDHRLRMDVAAFLSRYEDLQEGIFTIDQTGNGYSEPINVGRAKITGGEIEIDFRPMTSLAMTASAGLSQYQTTALGAAVTCTAVAVPIPTPAPGANCTIDGLSLGSPAPFLPEVTASSSISYTLAIPGGDSVILEADANYQSGSFAQATGQSADEIGGRVLMNSGITWRSRHSGWSVALSASNLSAKKYYINKNDSPWGQVLGEPGPPREWAATVSYSTRPAT
jgi:iron complex outermembrane receptor protein